MYNIRYVCMYFHYWLGLNCWNTQWSGWIGLNWLSLVKACGSSLCWMWRSLTHAPAPLTWAVCCGQRDEKYCLFGRPKANTDGAKCFSWTACTSLIRLPHSSWLIHFSQVNCHVGSDSTGHMTSSHRALWVKWSNIIRKAVRSCGILKSLASLLLLALPCQYIGEKRLFFSLNFCTKKTLYYSE